MVLLDSVFPCCVSAVLNIAASCAEGSLLRRRICFNSKWKLWFFTSHCSIFCFYHKTDSIPGAVLRLMDAKGGTDVCCTSKEKSVA